MRFFVGNPRRPIRFFFFLCGVSVLSACADQNENAAIYNQIYKNGWGQIPMETPQKRAFSAESADVLL